MNILVCGGRNFTDYEKLLKVLNVYSSQVSLIVHGAARGADTLAAVWAANNKTPVKAYPANWGLHGKSAGYIRNHDMITKEKIDLVVAFPGGRGTANMVKQARERNITVLEVT